MELSEQALSVILGGLLIVGLLLAFPALTTAIGLLRAHKTLRGLFWHIVMTRC
jgi:hypothetical protein